MNQQGIKARELRIGNLVNSFSDTNIFGIKEHEIKAQDIVDMDSDELASKGISVEPIPLSEEWLKRFGFETADAETDFMQWEKDGVEISNDGGLDEYHIKPFYFEYGSEYKRKEIKYVHELQNLFFALTGSELELQQQNP